MIKNLQTSKERRQKRISGKMAVPAVRPIYVGVGKSKRNSQLEKGYRKVQETQVSRIQDKTSETPSSAKVCLIFYSEEAFSIIAFGRVLLLFQC